VTTAIDAASARATMRSLSFDLLILDVMMRHDLASTSAFTEARSQVPILMLTARAEPEQRIEGLETGVTTTDQALRPRELLLRGQLLRRGGGATPATGEVRMGNLCFISARGELKCGKRDGPTHRSVSGSCYAIRSAARHAGVPP